MAMSIVTIFLLFIVCTCSNNTSAKDMYKNVPADILMKKAIIKFPWPIKDVPVMRPNTLINP